MLTLKAHRNYLRLKWRRNRWFWDQRNSDWDANVRNQQSAWITRQSYIMQTCGLVKLKRKAARMSKKWRRKSRVYQENHALHCMEIEDLRRTCDVETEKDRSTVEDRWTFGSKERRTLASESAIVSDARIARQSECLEWRERIFTFQRQRAECPTFPVNPPEFRVQKYAQLWFWVAALFKEFNEHFSKCFTIYLLKRNIFVLDCNCHGTRRKSETRTAEFNNTDPMTYKESCKLEVLCIVLEEFVLKIVWYKLVRIRSRKCISENSQTHLAFSVGELASRPKCAWAHLHLNSLVMDQRSGDGWIKRRS